METSNAKSRSMRKYCDELRQAIAADTVNVSFKLYREGLISQDVRECKVAERIVSSIESRLASDESLWNKLLRVLRECEFHALAGNLVSQLREEMRGENRPHRVSRERIQDDDQTSIMAVVEAKLTGTLEARLVAIEANYRDGQEKLSHQIYEQKRENSLLQAENRKLAKKVEELEIQLQQLTRVQRSLLSLNGPGWLADLKGTLSSPYPPCHIVMPNFLQHKKSKDLWHSPAFYSSPGGYKLCLQVAANGLDGGNGTYVSVFVILMKGPHDRQLEWPFEHEVTIRMLNWKKNEQHIEMTVRFELAQSRYKERIRGCDRAPRGPGNNQLLPHSFLYGDATGNTLYLHEDRLCLQVLKVEPPKTSSL